MNTAWRRPRILWVAVLVGVSIVFGWVYDRRRQPAIGTSVFLEGGGELRLCGVTWGREHRIEVGDLAARWLDRLPARYVPSWEWLTRLRTDIVKGQASFSEPHLVLWWVAPVHPRQPPPVPVRVQSSKPVAPRIPEGRVGQSTAGLLRWKVVAPGGATHGGVSMWSPPGGTRYQLHPITIDSFPRGAREFTVQLFERRASVGLAVNPGEAVEVCLGEFVIRNPEPSRAVAWRPDALPVRKESGGVTCELESFRGLDALSPTNPVPSDSQVSGAGRSGIAPPTVVSRVEVGVFTARTGGTMGSGGAVYGSRFDVRDDTRQAVASFVVSETGTSDPTWEVRQMLLTDPGGNVSYLLATESQRDPDGRLRLTCRTLPLWPEDGAWRLRLCLVRVGPVPSNRVLRLGPVPVAAGAGGNPTVLETNFLGNAIRAVLEYSPRPPATSFFMGPRPLSPGELPALRFEFEGAPEEGPAILHPMMRLGEVRTESGQLLQFCYVVPDTDSGSRTWTAAFQDPQLPPAGDMRVQALDLTVEFPEEREFEFRVPSTSAAGANAGANPR